MGEPTVFKDLSLFKVTDSPTYYVFSVARSGLAVRYLPTRGFNYLPPPTLPALYGGQKSNLGSM